MRMTDADGAHFAPGSQQQTICIFFHAAICLPPNRRNQPYFVMGSDGLGRDLFSRIVYGARVSMCVGLIGVLISFSLGITVGAFSGYVGGMTDNLIMRWSEIECRCRLFISCWRSQR